MKKKREYLKGKINELETNNRNKNIRENCKGKVKVKLSLCLTKHHAMKTYIIDLGTRWR
jgi:L-asparaginase II